MAEFNWKILWVTERYSPDAGGMAATATRQIQGLRKHGHTVDVVVFSEKTGPLRLKTVERDHGLDIRVNHDRMPGNAAQRAWREIQMKGALASYDLVCGFGCGFAGYSAVTFAKWLQVPSMVSVRGNDFDRDWFEPKRSGYVREALARADLICAVTPEKVDKIMSLYPHQNVFYLPNGVDADYWRLLPAEQETSRDLRRELGRDGRRIFGVFGELKYKKRIPKWLSAMRAAGLQDEISLLLVGRLDAEMQALVDDEALVPLTKHVEFCAPDKIAAYYHACDYVVIPSLFEGFPNVLLEAMACGVVPLVSDAGSMGHVVKHGENGFVFPAEDRAAAGAVAREALMLSAEELAGMKERARGLVEEKYTHAHELEQLMQMIFSLMRSHV